MGGRRTDEGCEGDGRLRECHNEDIDDSDNLQNSCACTCVQTADGTKVDDFLSSYLLEAGCYGLILGVVLIAMMDGGW